VVLGFHNGGDETLNVTNVMGSINSPASFNIYVQNFSAAVRASVHRWFCVSVAVPLRPQHLLIADGCQRSSGLTHWVASSCVILLSLGSCRSDHAVHAAQNSAHLPSVSREPAWITSRRHGGFLHRSATQSYGVVVPPGDEASLQYSFTPNKQLHPREFSVALTAFYSSAAGEARCLNPTFCLRGWTALELTKPLKTALPRSHQSSRSR
jgi:hypothetical protein